MKDRELRRREEEQRTLDSFQSEQREKANVFFLKKKQRDREKQLRQIFYNTCTVHLDTRVGRWDAVNESKREVL